MADPDQLAKLKEGIEAWNGWAKTLSGGIDLSDADLSDANLSGANLQNAFLQGANFSGAILIAADLTGAHLDGAYLGGANLSRAKLIGANLSGAILIKANLQNAFLQGANFSGSGLTGTDLYGAHLNGANLSGATLGGTRFTLTDLGNVTGLDKCKHLFQSSLDHRTLTRSGPLPILFLRGCGLPESLITYLPSLLNQPVQFYSCFISYSTKDQEFADRIHVDLQNKGVRCWFAPHDMAPGQKIHEQIDEAIRVYDRLLLILSEHSMNSEWVKTEIANARQREINDKRQMLFPVSLVDFQTIKKWKCPDGDTGKDSAREIREYFIPDFSTWKTNHDAYKESFDRLVKSLEAKNIATAQGDA